MQDYQTAKRFIIALEAFKGHDPEEYHPLVEPLSQFVFNNSFYNLEVVNELVKAMLGARTETRATEIEPSVTAQLLADQIKPWIESIRQTLFHSKTAPFSRIEDAQAWCDEAKKRNEEWHKRAEEWRKKAGERDRELAEWRKVLGEWRNEINAINEDAHLPEQVRLQLSRKFGELPTLEHLPEPPKLDSQVETYFALGEQALEIYKATGFTYASVEMYILADASPVLPTFTVRILRETHSLPSGASILNRFARVTIRGELTFEDLRSLYRSIRRELGIKRSKHPTAKHLQLYNMIRKRGDIPSREGTVKFWVSVMKEWNDLHPQDKYKTWKGVKLAYERIIAQFERRITTKEAQHERTGRGN